MMVHVRTSPKAEKGGKKKIQIISFVRIRLPISRNGGKEGRLFFHENKYKKDTIFASE